jgi:tetratricopeptide (TPR) repeat protein
VGLEAAAGTSEIARLEALLGADPGGPAFAALAEANRRAGRVDEAERVAREGLRRQPDQLAGRVALALALLDRDRLDEARAELERVLDAVPDHPLALAALRESGGVGPEALQALEEDEIEGAFAEAEAAVGEMVDANDLAAQALRAADLAEPEGVRAADLEEPEGVLAAELEAPFATRTVAELLERQGHASEAAALRRELARRSDDPKPASRAAGRDPRTEHLIATLERWLDNLRRDGR